MIDHSKADESFMRECFALAQRGIGKVSPNPPVGSVLVREGRIVSQGHRARFGGPHAEIECLRSCTSDARGSTLYLNLEPCSHYGKTPPCTEAIIRSGVSSVVVAVEDPNPCVSGRGIKRLREKGIQVRVGVLEDEARALNRFFFTHIRTHRPYVHLKVTQSLDGFIAPHGGRRQWISSRESRILVHKWRREHDAILIGARTALLDNPFLTTRLVQGRDPDVIVLDGKLSLKPSLRLCQSARDRRVIVCTDAAMGGSKKSKIKQLERTGCTVLQFPGRSGKLALEKVLLDLYDLNVGSLLIEGGGEVYAQVLRARIVDQISVFTAPTLLRKGVRWNPWSNTSSHDVLINSGHNIHSQHIGRDVLFQIFHKIEA
jgi:diaminohydroxyphosphoribosylaminopyrimidine deaminase / 5-amino-6-(5-phosphoribosylamino)uracil reductase